MKNRFDHVLQLKVALKGIKPPIWRRILVPCTYSFWDLHVAIQDAMGWLDYHLHQFHVPDPVGGEVLIVGIPMDDEWGDGPEVIPGWEIPVARHLNLTDRSVAYEYNFGDGWEHSVALEKILPRDPEAQYPTCLGGRRACPPEDCGGVHGYQHFLGAVQDPGHEEHEDMVRWVGGGFDPGEFDKAKVSFDDPSERWRRAFRSE